MILAHSVFEKPIHINEQYINMLVVENKQLLVNMITDFKHQISNSYEGDFVLSQDDKLIGFSDVELISDLFNVDFNKKKILNKLIGVISKVAVEEHHFENTQNIIAQMYRYIESVLEDLEYDITFDETTISDLFKISNLKIENDSESVPELLLEYFSIYTDFMKTKLFIIVNLHQFVDSGELELFYKDILYHKYNVLFIESHKPEQLSHAINLRIIDNDLCEIC